MSSLFGNDPVKNGHIFRIWLNSVLSFLFLLRFRNSYFEGAPYNDCFGGTVTANI